MGAYRAMTVHISRDPAALSGRVAIVTGASSGIGSAIAAALAGAGAKVVVASRSRDKLQALVTNIEADGGTAIACPADVTSENDVSHLFTFAEEKFGSVDILVNNAGVTSRLPTHDLPLSEWQEVIAVNVTGVFLCSREALRLMKSRGRGRIITIGSVAAKAPRHDAVAYSTSKSAIEGLVRSLAIDARRFGVSSCMIHPGNTRSALWTPQRRELADKEGLMEAETIGQVAVMVASMPDDVNMYETIIHPLTMPWMGRG